MGSDLVKRLIKSHCKVIACDIKMELLQKTFDAHPNLALFEMDVTNVEHINNAVTFTKEQLKKWNQTHLFGLVNNAGIARTVNQKFMAPLVELNDQEMLGVFGVNIFGVIRCTNAFYPLMKHTIGQWEEESPIVVNIASLAGKWAGPWFNYYTATKFAVVGYSDSLRRELKYAGVRVSCIEPGFTDTAIVKLTGADSSSVFGDIMAKARLSAMDKLILPLQPVYRVTDAICSCLFASNDTTPAHVTVDLLQKRIKLFFLMYLPYHVVDKILYKPN